MLILWNFNMVSAAYVQGFLSCICKHSTTIKAEIHHRKAEISPLTLPSINQQARQPQFVAFNLYWLKLFLTFLVQDISFIIPVADADRWTHQVQVSRWHTGVTFLPENPGNIWACWEMGASPPAVPDLSPPCCLTILLHFKQHENLRQLQVNYCQSVNTRAQIISQTTPGNDNQCSWLTADAASNY